MANVLIMGAAGKDFHVFNTLYRGNPNDRVVAFTATQIPDIAGRKYPPELAGPQYPQGIPIFDEKELETVIKDLGVNHVVFSYSDVNYAYIHERRVRAEAAGATFGFPDHDKTMIKSTKPVVAIVAVRTGAGKSQTSRAAAKYLRSQGKRVVAIRHPMPYGDLVAQRVQRFAEIADLAKHKCTIEEMEEYEPHIAAGGVIYAGVDYEAILREAEKEADIILWDGGNNDTPFYQPDLWITVCDPLRPGDELTYQPGDINFKRAHVLLYNKMDSSCPEYVAILDIHAEALNPTAAVIKADSELTVPDPAAIRGKKVLCVEDGPTTTHGGVRTGAATKVAERLGAAEIVDPRPYLKGRLQETFQIYPNIGKLLPAMGYGEQQIHDLEATINATPCDLVLIGTPIDLGRIVKINKPSVRVTYELREAQVAELQDVLHNTFLV